MKKVGPYDLDSLLSTIYNGFSHNKGIIGKILTTSEWIEFCREARSEVRLVYNEIRSLPTIRRESYLRERYQKYYSTLKTET